MKRHEKFNYDLNNLQMDENWEKRQKISKIVAGLFIVAAGTLILFKQMGVYIPHWLLSWKMILIAIGFVSLIKHKFSGVGGYIMILIGATFMLQDMFPELISSRFLWPIIIIFVGLFMIFKTLFKGKNKYSSWKKDQSFEYINNEDYIHATAILGGTTNKIVNKNLQGVSITSIMGGAEINMTQADFEKELIVNIDCVMGGVSLLVPSSWKVVSNVTTILGGMDDKRTPDNLDLISEPKTLFIKGTCVMGGIELDSYDKANSKNW